MVISRVIIRVSPFRALITLLITYLLSPLPLQVLYGHLGTRGFRVWVPGHNVQGWIAPRQIEQTWKGGAPGGTAVLA